MGSPDAAPDESRSSSPNAVSPHDQLPPQPQPKPPRDKRLIASAILGVCWIAFPPLAGFYILFDLQNLAAFLQRDLHWGFWGYVAVFAVTAGLGILPTYSQAFLGGWVFGMQWGLTGAILGFTGGAAIGYLFAQSITGDSVDRWIDRHPKGRIIRDALARGSNLRTFGIVTLLRLPPNSPFAMTNYALGATRVPFWLAMLATPVGMLPRTAVMCFLAASAAATGAQNIKEVFQQQPMWVTIAGPLSAVLVVVVIGLVANHALAKFAPSEANKRDGAGSDASPEDHT
ncbi:MAG: hypothetical protein RL591_494 [Planctomycetota bacterium]|jgi:uncharacterized membrane protein YdjX (TVP38/TMEM64 family)